MGIIGNLWHVWLICATVCYTIVVVNHLRRMRRISSVKLDNGITDGIGALFVFGWLSNVFVVLFLLSLLVNLIEYIK